MAAGVRLTKVLDLESIEHNIFRGASPDTRLQRNFGGQVAGQALVAATRTVPSDLVVHSLHAYFLRPGQPRVPTLYVVDRVRDGRSFVTRRISGIQRGENIFIMNASFHRVGDEGPEHADVAPLADPPEDVPDAAGSDPALQELHRAEWPDWDVRRVPTDRLTRTEGLAAQQRVWLRHRRPLPDDPVFHACALTYASDMTLLGCAAMPYRDGPHTLQVASLDHAVWFLRPFRADGWLLYDQTSPSAGQGRGLTHGRIFDAAGHLVANVVQEGLVRYARL